jgi:hypothetical protein
MKHLYTVFLLQNATGVHSWMTGVDENAQYAGIKI